MSCGSTTCTLALYDLPASKPLFSLAWFRPGLLAWLTGKSGVCDQRYQRRRLLELDDRLLADIGISREQAIEQACKSASIRPAMWRIYQ